MAHRVTAPALKRAQRLLDQRVRSSVYLNSIDFKIEATEETFEPVSYPAAVTAPRSPFVIGTKWGRPWHSRWFRLTATVPPNLAKKVLHAVIDLGFLGHGDGFQVEGLAWRDGRVVHAVQPDRRTVNLGTVAEGEKVELWVEAAATPVIAGHVHGYGPTPLGDPATAPSRPLYTLRRASLATFDANLDSLATELQVLIDLALDTDHTDPMYGRIFAALDAAAHALDVNDKAATAQAARAALRAVLDVGNGPAAHQVTATGHAHLDTAWLWPIREARRKALRTFANAVYLLEHNPDMVYCHSQAQHYAWVAEDNPSMFARVSELVAERRWEPVGGMWVETDLNLPDGESLIRQMVQGQRAFEGWFGRRCDGAFLPDDFGYPAGLPQIVSLGGARWFFTQKLSWNETNRFPHHTFWWEGLDGTRMFTHFSPIDTYNALNTPSQLRFASQNFSDHAGASSSLVLFGYGDGGGGPTQVMVDRARIARDLAGVPRVTMGRVTDFFARSMAEYSDTAPVWTGEMYFEKHRGTYSTQVGTKQGNLRSEQLLHEVEAWAALAGTRPSGLDPWWQRVLTQQFHDIIPGSSIAWVHRDAEAEHAAVAAEINDIIPSLLGASGGDAHIANPSSARFRGVVDTANGLAFVDVPPFGWSAIDSLTAVTGSPLVETVKHDGAVTMSCGAVSVTIGGSGALVSLRSGDRDVIPSDDHACFVLRQDTPAEYDNWDIDMSDANRTPEFIPSAAPPEVTESGPLRASVTCRHETTHSCWTVRWSLDCTGRVGAVMDADWHENETRLQWRLPTDIHSHDAVCGTQFGHVHRPRHTNTSWDAARFEVCAHRWVAIAEPRFGVALLANGPRGYDARNDVLQLTLLRSPRFPDPEADRGRRHIEWSLRVLDGGLDVAALEAQAETSAHPMRMIAGAPSLPSESLSWSVPGSLISALKPADDGSGDVIIRAWETTGGRCSGSFTFAGFSRAIPCGVLEDEQGPELPQTSGRFAVSLGAFEIATWRLSR